MEPWAFPLPPNVQENWETVSFLFLPCFALAEEGFQPQGRKLALRDAEGGWGKGASR